MLKFSVAASMAVPIPLSLIIEPKAPPAAVMRMITPAISNGFKLNSHSFLEERPFCLAQSQRAIAVPNPMAIFLSPRNARIEGKLPVLNLIMEAMAMSTIGRRMGSIDRKKEGG